MVVAKVLMHNQLMKCVSLFKIKKNQHPKKYPRKPQPYPKLCDCFGVQ